MFVVCSFLLLVFLISYLIVVSLIFQICTLFFMWTSLLVHLYLLIFVADFSHYLLFLICYFDCCKFTISNLYLAFYLNFITCPSLPVLIFIVWFLHYLFFVIFSFDCYKFNISNWFFFYMDLISFSFDLIFKFTLQVLALLWSIAFIWWNLNLPCLRSFISFKMN